MVSRIKINIGGTELPHYINLSISQPFDDHHWMSISIGTEDIRKAQGLVGSSSATNLGSLTKDWAGKKVTVVISQGETDLAGILSPVADQVFEGLVTRINFQMRDAVDSNVVITAMSPTFLLESGANTFSFVEKPLSDIIDKVCTSVRAHGWPVFISPSADPTIPYVTSYRETFFHFAQRLARQNGEWFYYNGTTLVFGKSAARPTQLIELEYGSNLLDMSYETRLVDLANQSRIYDYLNDDTYAYASTGNEVNVQNVAQEALKTSLDTLTSQNIELSHQHFPDSTSHEASVVRQLRMESNQLAVLSGTATCLGMAPGGLVSVKDDVQLNGITTRTDTYGEFLLTKVFHYVDANGRYQNTFEAIPSNPAFPPTTYPKVSAPVAETQHGIVTDTNDPDQLGRVKVKFPWHPSDTTTPWIRVANPMSGAGTGVYFVPEVDERVFVDFDHGDPDMPFVRGGFFHKNHQPGNKFFDSHNNFKGFITKGGNHILIDDTDGKENIKIYNKESKNELVMSLDGGSHIHIKSNGKIRMDADSIEMNAKNITVKTEDDFKLTSKNTIMESNATIEIFSENSLGIGSTSDFIAISSPTEVRVLSDADINLKALNIAVEASVGLKAKGVEVEIEGTAQATLKSSAMATLDGGAMTTVKGGLVMIN